MQHNTNTIAGSSHSGHCIRPLLAPHIAPSPKNKRSGPPTLCVCVSVCSRSLRNTWQMLICGKPMRFLPIERSQNLPIGKYFANCSQSQELDFEAWPSVCSSNGSLLRTTWHMFDLTIGTLETNIKASRNWGLTFHMRVNVLDQLDLQDTLDRLSQMGSQDFFFNLGLKISEIYPTA